jgi:hypothetical protein
MEVLAGFERDAFGRGDAHFGAAQRFGVGDGIDARELERPGVPSWSQTLLDFIGLSAEKDERFSVGEALRMAG